MRDIIKEDIENIKLKITRLLLIFIFLPCFGGALRGQSKMQLEVHSAENTKQLIYSSKGDSAQLYNELKTLLTQKQQDGYLNASIDSLLYFPGRIVAYIGYGKLYNWASIQCPPDVQNKLTALHIKCKIPSGPVQIGQYLQFNESLISALENKGYPFCSLRLDSLCITEKSIGAVLKVDTGPRYYFDSICIRGTAEVKANFIRQYTGFLKGEVYDQSVINSSESKLQRLSYINITKASEIGYNTPHADLFLYIDKKPANHISGLLGLGSDEENKNKLKLTGELNLQVVNLLRNGESFDLQWQSSGNNSQELSVETVFPYIWGTAIGIDAGFSLYKYDTLYLRTNPSLGLRVYFGGTNYFRFFVESHRTDLLAHTSSYQTNMAQSSSILYGTGLYVSNIENLRNPAKGYVVSVSASIGNKEQEADSITQTLLTGEIKTNLGLYVPLAGQVLVALQGRASALLDKNIYTNELYEIGGANNMRGFDEKSLPASSYAVLTCELRYRYSTNNRLFVFTDAGIVQNRADANTSLFPLGVGAGINFETSAGQVAVSYSIGWLSSTSPNLRNTKVHIGFVNNF